MCQCKLATRVANDVIRILRSCGWSRADILNYHRTPHPDRDTSYEEEQFLSDAGRIEVGADELRAAICQQLRREEEEPIAYD